MFISTAAILFDLCGYVACIRIPGFAMKAQAYERTIAEYHN